MRWPVAILALALCLVGCGPRDEVPLITVQPKGACCWLLYQVVDVSADSTYGTVNKDTGQPLRWPKGYSARHVGAEVEVLDPTGKVVLTTGGRYWMSPIDYEPEWIIGEVRPCPDCEVGQGVL